MNRLIKVEVATENMEGAQWNAILLATLIAVLLFGGVLAFAINMYSQDKINIFLDNMLIALDKKFCPRIKNS